MKKTLKAVLLSSAGLFLAYRSYELARILLANNAKVFSPFEESIYAVLLCVFVTGFVALPGFALPTSGLLPKRYYAIAQPNTLTKWYRWLGVETFKKLLMFTFWGKAKNRKHYFDGTRNGFQNLIYQSKQSEFGHLIPFIALQLIAFLALMKGLTIVFGIITSINIVGNFYPIILQRMHRARLARLLNRIERGI